MGSIETTISSSPGQYAAEELLRERTKIPALTKYQGRSRKRMEMLQDATVNEAKSLNRSQAKDQADTERLVTNSILSAWTAAIKTLRRSENVLARIRAKASSFDSAGVHEEMEIFKPRLERLTDPAELRAIYESALRGKRRSNIKAVCELGATKLYRIETNSNPHVERGMVKVDAREIHNEARVLRKEMEATLAGLETNSSVDKFTEENEKAQADVRRVMDQIDETNRIFGYDGFFGGGPFDALQSEIEINGIQIQSAPEEQANKGYASGYVAILEGAE